MSQYKIEYEIMQPDGNVVHAVRHVEADEAGKAYDMLLEMIGRADLKSIKITSIEMH